MYVVPSDMMGKLCIIYQCNDCVQADKNELRRDITAYRVCTKLMCQLGYSRTLYLTYVRHNEPTPVTKMDILYCMEKEGGGIRNIYIFIGWCFPQRW